ncbi:hypothetical protein QK324_07380 [Serratia ureilytica]|uniref:hypothetical protein n=1 Tax=Serratia ureilytica TaxID=300181 RepID=UPI00249C2DEA|nr:hypothetical protein [Serratia ureilytica]MDI3197837.1 hypothetical protein [Serratia ureilytica]
MQQHQGITLAAERPTSKQQALSNRLRPVFLYLAVDEGKAVGGLIINIIELENEAQPIAPQGYFIWHATRFGRR